MSALIESYSADNRVVDVDLAVKYSQTKVYGNWSYVSGMSIITLRSAWNYIRTATKNYRYVGMTKAAADACAEDMRDLYQRTVKVSEFSTSGEFEDVAGGSIPMADVCVQNTGGDMWSVIVNVSESDSRTRIANASPSALFQEEDNRDYDED